jgi:hypothetical protein
MAQKRFPLLSFLFYAYADLCVQIGSYYLSRYGQRLFFFFSAIFFCFFLYDTYFFYYFYSHDTLYHETIAICLGFDFNFLDFFVVDSFSFDNFTLMDDIIASSLIPDSSDFKFMLHEPIKWWDFGVLAFINTFFFSMFVESFYFEPFIFQSIPLKSFYYRDLTTKILM